MIPPASAGLPLSIRGRVTRCEIGNFIVLSRGDEPAVAYVADPDEADLIVESVNHHAELQESARLANADFVRMQKRHDDAQTEIARLKSLDRPAPLPALTADAWKCDKHGREFVREYCRRCADDTASKVLAECLTELDAEDKAAALTADLLAALRESLRSGYLFGHYDEPLDAAGKRIVRVIEQRIARADALSARQTEEEKIQAHVDEPATSRGVATASTVEPTSTLPPTCPIHGYVMVQQFDYTLVNPNTTVATPNGTYSCLACDSQHVDEDAWAKGKVEWS